MRIVISGVGEVGTHLAKMLSGASHDITVIDDDPKRIEEVAGMADVVTIEGDCTTFAVLKKASVRKADLFIAVRPEESINIISAVLAKQLGARKAIARIDNNEYLEPNNKEMFINMGIDYLFYPEKVAAREVINLLGHTSTTEYVDFSGGKLSLVVFKLDSSSPLIGRTLIEVTADREALPYRTVAISRDGDTIIPRGSDQFQEGDTVYVIANQNDVKSLMVFSGKPNIEVNNIMILGGSRIGVRIATELQDEANVKLVEYNPDKAYKLTETLEKTLIISDDGRNIDSMIEEGLSNMDAFVAVTGRSETNILAAMVAKRLGVKKVIAEVENLNFINLAESMGIDTIINKADYGEQHLPLHDEYRQAIKCLTGCDAEVLEFIAKPNSPATKGQIRELDFPHDAVIGGLCAATAAISLPAAWRSMHSTGWYYALPSAIARIGRFLVRALKEIPDAAGGECVSVGL